MSFRLRRILLATLVFATLLGVWFVMRPQSVFSCEVRFACKYIDGRDLSGMSLAQHDRFFQKEQRMLLGPDTVHAAQIRSGLSESRIREGILSLLLNESGVSRGMALTVRGRDPEVTSTFSSALVEEYLERRKASKPAINVQVVQVTPVVGEDS